MSYYLKGVGGYEGIPASPPTFLHIGNKFPLGTPVTLKEKDLLVIASCLNSKSAWDMLGITTSNMNVQVSGVVPCEGYTIGDSIWLADGSLSNVPQTLSGNHVLFVGHVVALPLGQGILLAISHIALL